MYAPHIQYSNSLFGCLLFGQVEDRRFQGPNDFGDNHCRDGELDLPFLCLLKEFFDLFSLFGGVAG